MAKELFDYTRVPKTEYAYYGFHLKNGRYHIDTKRLKKLHAKGCFPEEMFTNPRNTHYFVPRHKNDSDYAINLFRVCLNQLSRDWNNEYKNVIKKLTTPKEVYDQTRLGELAYSSSPKEDLEEIEFDALRASVRRDSKLNEVIKSIHLQYIQKMFVEYFRCIYIVIRDRGFGKKDDFQFKDFFYHVQEVSKAPTKKANPLYKMPHYRYFNALNKIDNFLKHNTRQSYNALANNPYEKDEKEKEFLASLVFSEEEAGTTYESGVYAGNWLKIDSTYVEKTIGDLYEFSKEFCKFMYNEDEKESFWNSDEALLKTLRDNFFDFM